LLDIPGPVFVSLQRGEEAKQLKESGRTLLDWMDECEDFLDTAALIEQLDLVISVDTAAAHLAGALGKPVWLLNRFESEWRWMLKREDSPWYPSMKIFRQSRPGDWDEVIARVATALRQRFGL
jgi:ADP-heptose:LPS heptosyltransferase